MFVFDRSRLPLAKYPTITVRKASIPVLLVSYSASVQAGEPTIDINSISNDASNTSARLKTVANADQQPRFVTVANAGEQLNQDHYKDGKINLNKVGFGQLQGILDSYAKRDCAHEVQSSCRWKVLKLERTGRGSDGEQLSGISAVLPPKVVSKQNSREPDTAKPVKVASSSSQRHSTPAVKDEPRPAIYQPTQIASAVEQRVTSSEWIQSFSARPPDKTNTATAELATPVAINLTQQSEVRLLVDGDEKNSDILDAGYNLLDTSSLPEGNYPIEIKVSNDREGQRIIRQTYGRRYLAAHRPTTSYGVFQREPTNRPQTNAKKTSANNIALSTTVITSLNSTSLGSRHDISTETSISSASNASQTADLILARRGNQYQLALDGAISSDSALGMTLQAAYLGKKVTLFLQDTGFVPARELTGDPALAKFLGVAKHSTRTKPVWYQGDFNFPLIPIRHQDPTNGLVESRAHFANRLAQAPGAHSNGESNLHFRLLDMRELDEIQLHAKFEVEINSSTANHRVLLSELEIETPFINLA